MNFVWKDKRCIICTEEKPLSLEHIIPEALSGILTANFLCASCNSNLGAYVDHSACSDPAIRQVAFAMEDISVERWAAINQKLGQNQKLIVRMNGQEFKAKTKGETVKITPFKNTDGKWIDTIKLDDSATFHPVGKRINSLLLLKVAYEFLALCVGPSIFGEQTALVRAREALKTLNERDAFVEVFPRETNYPLHGIAFEGNEPCARVQVRLFGSLAYRVNFPELNVSGIRWAYTHYLHTGAEETVDRDEPRQQASA